MQRRKSREDDSLITEEHDLKEANYGSLKKNPESKIKEYIYETLAFGPEKIVKLSSYESLGGGSEHNSKDANQSKQKNVEGSTTSLKVPQKNKGCLVNSTANFFSDEKTRIDFILVWESDCQNPEGQNEEKGNPKSKQKRSIEMHKEWREKFLHKLQMKGISIEKHAAQHTKKVVHYILLSAPWSVLCYYAEDLRLRVPLQAMPIDPEVNWSHRILMKLGIPNLLYDDVPDIPLDNYTCHFKANKLRWFRGSDDHETFFSSTQRHRILYEILSTISYGNPNAGQVGIERLLNEEVFTAAFPLHDGPYKMSSEEEPTSLLNQRQILFHYWAKWSKWKKYQPLNHIRRYFGEKIALYFAWLGFYTAWLLPAAVVGTLVFIIGIFLMFHDIPTQEICSSGDKYKMCPLCKVCPYWNLSSVCPMFQERPRPQFAALAPMTIVNPITGEEEPYFPKRTRFNRIITGSMVIIIMIAVVIIFLISIILYRAIISVIVSRSGNVLLVSSASRIASLTGSVVNLLFILLLSKIYIALALFLTKWEMHRTQTTFEDAFTFKVFIFEFINFYSSPIYIAFFKGRFVGYPGHYDKLLGIRNEDCAPGGCLIELAQELLVIMVGKQVINNIQEILIPKMKTWWHKQDLSESNKAGQDNFMKQLWESDYKLLPYDGLFAEYLEMVLQFGFITIFVAACPLAPLFALLNNWAEIRLDAQKFVCEYRRPVAERAQGIGIWFHILEVITHFAVISNAFLIAFTSDFLPRLYYQYTRASNLQGYIDFTLAYAPKSFDLNNNATCRYRAYREQNGRYSLPYWNLLAIRLGFIIVFEHVVFFIARMIDMMVPDIPEAVAIKVKREQYLAKQALAENKALIEVIDVVNPTQPGEKVSK
ncbi:anoctamin-7 isoform X5 [Crotalus tigris]|uniref:anoctamin-7 isoform X5 n=1 Tax=Crotalus tigris TaxID=88082 RepID=UPI00192F79C3|nr:anoctamin-7 isoform X5 [Crotalus tigris]